jgi:hypothetical protein
MLFCLLALSLAQTGCQFVRVHKIELSADIVNDDDTLLTVEGQTNLPDGAEVEAILSDTRGRRLAFERGQVSHGKYFSVLDISQAPGFRILSLEVFFDPLTASAQVQGLTGSRGEAMSGPLIEDSHERQIAIVRRRLMLQMSPREAMLRKLGSGDGDMSELESLLTRHPDDPEILIGLGLAYLKQRPSERHPNSRAEVFIKQGIALHPRSRQLELQARLWLSRLEAEAREVAEQEARAQHTQPADPFHTQSEIRPGEGMGAFHLGMPGRFIRRHFLLEEEAGAVNATEDRYALTDLRGVEVGLDRTTGNLTSLATTDPRFKTSAGVGVGLLIEDVRKSIPAVGAIAYGPEEKRADGRLYIQGKVELNGLTLTFERNTNPVFPVPMERVIKVEVTVASSAETTATPTPQASAGPTVP